MTSFFAFMASVAGRITRIVAGLVLVALDVCLFAPLFRLPFKGALLRAATT